MVQILDTLQNMAGSCTHSVKDIVFLLSIRKVADLTNKADNGKLM
jgi:hypothetical protein